MVVCICRALVWFSQYLQCHVEVAWDVYQGSAEQLHEGALCNLCIHTSGSLASVIATGRIVIVELPDFAMIEIRELVAEPHKTALHYVMLWNLWPGSQVMWLIQYLFPAQDVAPSTVDQRKAHTFLTPGAKEIPSMGRKDQKLEQFKNIIWPRL
jgi:hypothetical protein